MGQIAREAAWRRKTVEDSAVTLHVTLDWLVRVEGTTDEEEAARIVRDYLADQDLQESVAIDPPDPEDWELTIVLYPDDEEVPRNDAGSALAASWSTYTRAPAERGVPVHVEITERGQRMIDRQLQPWCGDPALHEAHFTDSATECPGVSEVRAAR